MRLTLLGIAIVLFIAWLVIRRRSRSADAQAVPVVKDTAHTAYHAVSIRFEKYACDAAKEMSGRRFLANAAPRLPLPECDRADCQCRFTHYQDRRSGHDRRSPFAGAGFGGGTGSFTKERRERRERRADTDSDDF